METTPDREDGLLRVLYDDPPAGDPPAGDPPAGDPPAGDPPAGDPPAGDPSTAVNWRDHVPDDLKTHAALAKIDNIEGMGRSLVSAQNMLGRDPNSLMVVPPADDAVGMRAAMTKLGLPDDISGYKLSPIEDGVAFMAPDTQLAKDWIAFSHKEGMLPSHTNAAYGFLAKYMTQQHKDAGGAMAAQAETNATALKTEWGEAFDKNIRLADFAVDKLGGDSDDFRSAINDTGLGTNPAVMKALVQVGSMLAEDDTGGGGGPTGGFGDSMDPNEARARGKSMLEEALNETNPQKARAMNVEAQKMFARANKGTIA